jgi:hypothetical protein
VEIYAIQLLKILLLQEDIQKPKKARVQFVIFTDRVLAHLLVHFVFLTIFSKMCRSAHHPQEE